MAIFKKKDPENKLRSWDWFGVPGRTGFHYRGWIKKEGFTQDCFSNRPVIGICNSASELTPCNVHLYKVAEAVKRGVWMAGGFPLEFPTISLGETVLRPTSMLFRNLMSMDVEEMIRGNPLDGVVLLAGCDKTTPAQIMGAASVDLPTLMLTGGPMLNGYYKGKPVGSGTDERLLDAEIRAGRLSQDAFLQSEGSSLRSDGHCNTMGTASTMATMAEALGLQLPGSAAIPAVDSNRYRMAEEAGKRIVDMVKEDLRISKILTRQAFENAIKVNTAIGGSTNAIVHLLAMAGRAGVSLSLDDFHDLSQDIPLLVNLKPSGEYLMEEYYVSGGLQAVLKEIAGKLHHNTMTVTGKAFKHYWDDAENFNEDVIRPVSNPVKEHAPITVLYGNICPNGAIIKTSAADENLLTHTGRAVVFDSIEDMKARIDSDELDVNADDVLVLKHCGPKGYPGMPEVGDFPIPKKLLEQGVRDMIRISDARMSGTAFGTVVLHVSPEATDGGPLAVIENGDMITMDAPNQTLNLHITDDDLNARLKNYKKPDNSQHRGYKRLYVEHVQQAHLGADFDFLVGGSGSKVERYSH